MLALVGWHSPTRIRTIDNGGDTALHTAPFHATCSGDNKKKQGRRGDDGWRVEWVGRAWHQRSKHLRPHANMHIPRMHRSQGLDRVSVHSDSVPAARCRCMTPQTMHSAILLGDGRPLKSAGQPPAIPKHWLTGSSFTESHQQPTSPSFPLPPPPDPSIVARATLTNTCASSAVA